MGMTSPQRARSSRRLAGRLVVAAVLLGAVFVTGCGKKKHYITAPVPPRSLYEEPVAPEAVLRNLALAYSTRDSTEYKSLFDENYQGTSIDQAAPSPPTLTYTKADEARHIAALAKSATITSIELRLTLALARFTDVGDPPGWASIQNPIQLLAIYDGADAYVVDLGREYTEFKFIPTTPAPSSPSDTTWKIIRWTEIAF